MAARVRSAAAASRRAVDGDLSPEPRLASGEGCVTHPLPAGARARPPPAEGLRGCWNLAPRSPAAAPASRRPSAPAGCRPCGGRCRAVRPPRPAALPARERSLPAPASGSPRPAGTPSPSRSGRRARAALALRVGADRRAPGRRRGTSARRAWRRRVREQAGSDLRAYSGNPSGSAAALASASVICWVILSATGPLPCGARVRVRVGYASPNRSRLQPRPSIVMMSGLCRERYRNPGCGRVRVPLSTSTLHRPLFSLRRESVCHSPTPIWHSAIDEIDECRGSLRRYHELAGGGHIPLHPCILASFEISRWFLHVLEHVRMQGCKGLIVPSASTS